MGWEDGNFEDDWTISGDVTGSTKTAEEIKKDNEFRTIPPGRHILTVMGFKGPPEFRNYPCKLPDESLSGYTSATVMVLLGLPGDPKASKIQDFFVLPPDTPEEDFAYKNGRTIKKDPNTGKDIVNNAKGFMADKFYYFMSRLIPGSCPKGEPMSEEARTLKLWVGRQISVEVEPGTPYKDEKTGKQRDGFPSVRLWSYETVVGNAASRSGRPTPNTSNPAPQTARPVPKAATPSAAEDDNGLSDV